MPLPESAATVLARAGCRQVRPIAGGQNLVVGAQRDGRAIVAKLRRSEMALRLHKELRWLGEAACLGIAVPPCLGLLCEVGWTVLVLERVAEAGDDHPPLSWARSLAALHQHPGPLPGWGHLRADDQPRFADRDTARRHHEDLLHRAGLDGALAREALAAHWEAARPRLLHGDAHRGNRIGRVLLDWEHVRIGDPLEDAAHLALAEGGGHGAWAEAWDESPSSPRWLGARLLVAAEALVHGGPCQAGARRLLAHLG